MSRQCDRHDDSKVRFHRRSAGLRLETLEKGERVRSRRIHRVLPLLEKVLEKGFPSTG